MPTVAPTIARSANNRQWMRYRTDRSFETGDFFSGKRARDLFSLGLVYHSMALLYLNYNLVTLSL
jgi:hypothetical protein